MHDPVSATQILRAVPGWLKESEGQQAGLYLGHLCLVPASLLGTQQSCMRRPEMTWALRGLTISRRRHFTRVVLATPSGTINSDSYPSAHFGN